MVHCTCDCSEAKLLRCSLLRLCGATGCRMARPAPESSGAGSPGAGQMGRAGGIGRARTSV